MQRVLSDAIDVERGLELDCNELAAQAQQLKEDLLVLDNDFELLALLEPPGLASGAGLDWLASLEEALLGEGYASLVEREFEDVAVEFKDIAIVVG